MPVDHPGFHPTSLVRFRAWLLLHGKERLVFERSLELAAGLGLLEGEAERIVDSTPMPWAAAVQDTATLVRSGSGGCSTRSRPPTRPPPSGSARRLRLTTRARARTLPVTGTTGRPVRRC